jgi:acyl carrier protein
MSQKILPEVKKCLIKTLKLNESKVKEDASLKEDYGLDSMSTLTFLLELEDNIKGFVVDPDTLEPDDLLTLQSITDYVLKQVA